VVAAGRIRLESGQQNGRGERSEIREAPAYAKNWLLVNKDAGLIQEDVDMIYANVQGSMRGEANRVAHEFKRSDQAAAVRAESNEQQREGLTRIFKFVHHAEVHEEGEVPM